MKPDEAILPNVFQNRSSSTREAAPPEEPEPFLEEPEPSQTDPETSSGLLSEQIKIQRCRTIRQSLYMPQMWFRIRGKIHQGWSCSCSYQTFNAVHLSSTCCPDEKSKEHESNIIKGSLQLSIHCMFCSGLQRLIIAYAHSSTNKVPLHCKMFNRKSYYIITYWC